MYPDLHVVRHGNPRAALAAAKKLAKQDGLPPHVQQAAAARLAEIILSAPPRLAIAAFETLIRAQAREQKAQGGRTC